MYEAHTSRFQIKHIQNISRSQVMHTEFELRPVFIMASTCMLSVIRCSLEQAKCWPQRRKPTTLGHNSQTLMFLEIGVAGGSSIWLQPGSIGGKAPLFQVPNSQSFPNQAPKPSNEASEYMGRGWSSLMIQALPLKTPQKASHHFRSSLIGSSRGIRLECLV